MKIRNLILAGLAICTMASCSKDEAVDIYANGPVDATLSFNAVASVEMKGADYGSEDNGRGNEAKVKTLDVYIFKEGALQVYKNYTVEPGKYNLLTSDFMISHLTVKKAKESEHFVMYLVANCVRISDARLEDFQTKSIAGEITDYELGGYMPMVGKVEFDSKDIKPLVDEEGKWWENWISDKNIYYQSSDNDKEHNELAKPTGYSSILLTRVISRVQVESLTVDLVDNEQGNASFALRRLSLVNVPKNVTVGADGIIPWIKTYESGSFGEKDHEIISKRDNENCTFLEKVNLLNNPLTKTYDNQLSGNVTFNDSNKFYAYTFPNNEGLIATTVNGITEAKNYKTILLISGLYKATANDPGSLKQFRIPIETPGKGNIVEPNHIYLVTVKITGQGSSNEDGYESNAHVSATIKIAPWKVVIQEEEDAN